MVNFSQGMDIANSSLAKNIKNSYLFFRFKYPKFFLLAFFTIIAYKLFSNSAVSSYVSNLGNLGYFGIFIAGLLFSFGFTSPFAVGFFIVANPTNIFLASIIGGLGALVSDLLIFTFIKMTFEDEFETLKKEKIVKEINLLINKNIGSKIKTYILYFFAGILIASPLPDEVGVTMLAGLTAIKGKTLGLISFTLNTLGIFTIIYISSMF